MTESKQAKSSLSGLYVRNYAANISGNLIIILLNIFTPLEALRDWQIFLRQGGWVLLVVFMPLVFISAGVLQYLIQRPIAAMLRRTEEGGEMVTSLQIFARRRLLNLPLVIALVNLTMWITLTAVFVPFLHYSRDVPHITGMYLFFRGILIGLLASFISFFLIDDYSRKHLIPQFFPEGRLAGKSGTIKISILRRIRVLFGTGTGMPMLILVGTLSLIIWELDDSVISASEFGKEIFIFIIIVYIIFFSIALVLNFLVGKSVLDPIKKMMGIVKKVRYGDYHQKVRVVSNDELGVLGDGMNEMTAGLIERERMRQSLDLAREVQQTLLPQTDPKGEMFGKAPIYRIIRLYSDTDAKGLLTACLFSLEKFRDGVKPEDDVTMIVVKITQE